MNLKRRVIRGFLISWFCFGFSVCPAQQNAKAGPEEMLHWLSELYEAGVFMTEDSLQINQESLELLRNEDYRNLIYPEIYSWEITKRLIEARRLKPAFWYMINLYPQNDQNKDLVVKAMLTYDSIFQMDKVLISTFYTYCYMDPEIGQIVDGDPRIDAPHILEQKLHFVREIIFYMEEFKRNNQPSE
ncbi:hypothetical protein [Jiulongibacter sediminis]|uniref:Uncharacterized protein n=1 Tax=Jiulongibacter sediminis TaxID=1605367 RepID=A0A0N8HAB0_9BACT|nr:hypothetical protein [Jiulongibacter sediminis]KPM49668.1 hypothetical protein AFM12_03490 [Jiulongibacter sediminis]TBX26706.1 hypothetical protein TK44_03495 [Jiulongibacter sediminis]